MAVVYEEVEEGLIKAYSDKMKKIHGGSPESDYDVAYDPKDAHRTYIETNEWIDTYIESTGRVFSKLSLELALFDMGLLDLIDAFIDLQQIVNKNGQTMPLRRAYDTALTFDENNEYFSYYVNEIKSRLGLTDLQIESLLSLCIAK